MIVLGLMVDFNYMLIFFEDFHYLFKICLESRNEVLIDWMINEASSQLYLVKLKVIHF